ncbi:MAG: signal peptidase I [Clostridia bacterium]|nr:signal peptidase I [Clostridia bacterium]
MEGFKKIGKIILNIITVIVIIAIIFAVYNFVQLKCFNKKYANFFGYTILEVSTGSMAETINIYDIIVVKLTKDVNVNDIITFEQDDVLITHRIIEMKENEIITKGDANNTKDRSIKNRDIIGKVVFIGRRLGIWIKVIAEPKVFISMLITIVLITKVFSKENK